MTVRTKPFRLDFEDLVAANRVVVAPALAYQRRVFCSLALLMAIPVGLLAYLRGKPSSEGEIIWLVIGFGMAAVVYCLTVVAGTFSSKLLRRQLRSREMEKYREKNIHIELEGGVLRIVRESGESTLRLDEMTKFSLPSGTVCLLHAGYNSFVLVRKEHFEEPKDWEAFQSLLVHTPSLGTRKF